jgi:hypothetical protein
MSHSGIDIILNYAASATISCFQAFRFLPEMQVLSGIEKLETPCQETISFSSNRKMNFSSRKDTYCQGKYEDTSPDSCGKVL